MFEITLNEDQSFHIEGNFYFGYMGLYTDRQIQIIDDVEEVKRWNIITKNGLDNAANEEILKFLNAYFHNFEMKIQKNLKYVNDNFLLNTFLDMDSCGNEFWNIKELTIPSAMPENPDEDIYPPHWEIMSKLEKEYRRSPNDGSVQKTDVETILREKFPMFNFDYFIANICSEHLSLSDGLISFQCSDKLEQTILCSAYDELDENLVFTDWHNF